MSHLHAAEFVPALPALGGAAELALSLFTLVLWGVALGLAIAWRYTIGAALEWAANMMDRLSFSVVGHRVRPFGAVSGQLRAIDYGITAGLNHVLVGAEHATVWLFRTGLNLIVWTGREIWALSRDTLRTFEHYRHAVIPDAIRIALGPAGAFAVYVEQVIARHARTLRHDLTALIHGDTRPITDRLHVAENTIAHALPRVGRLERDVTRQGSRVRRLEELVTLAGFSAFMWRWLGRHGLRWLRCPSLARIGSRIGCGGFGLLEDLLALSFVALAATDICAFAGALERLAEWYRPLLMDLVDVEDALIGCGKSRLDPNGYTKPEPLGLPRLYLPPVPDPLPLS